MLQPAAFAIPAPLPADSETVITALETAALFGQKGDALEAVRWLRRAAASAGEAGDDARALALSRSAADLNEELSAKHSVPPSPLPSAPPPSVRPSYPTPPSSRAGYRRTTPPSSPTAAPQAPGGSRATRVAIHRSPTATGAFEVRVLAEGEHAGPGDAEAFLVMIDPASTLLTNH